MEIKSFFANNPEYIGILIEGELHIKNNTQQGYLKAEVYDGIDLNYIKQNKRRGRVQKQISQTLTCGATLGVVVEW